jgi:replicative DNA helicase
MLLAKAKKVQYHDVVRKAPEKKFFFAEKEPVLSDLGESGKLEQNAYAVMFLHKENDPASQNVTHLKLAKHRNGPTATITVGFQGHMSRFADMPKA